MPHIITCPTGLTGSIRGLKVREERFLADRKLAKTGSVVDELLRACWEETHDAGPYDFGGKTIDWDKVLQGDRFFALIEIRALTYGSEYAFSVTCSEAGCRARIDWELDLRQPGGRVLPCSSFQQGIGSLLHQHYSEIYESRAARYWRDREYLPAPCRGCEDADLCGGACPLYWDAAGSFEEIPHAGSSDADAHRAWAARRRDGASWGVPGPRSLPVLQAGEGR